MTEGKPRENCVIMAYTESGELCQILKRNYIGLTT